MIMGRALDSNSKIENWHKAVASKEHMRLAPTFPQMIMIILEYSDDGYRNARESNLA